MILKKQSGKFQDYESDSFVTNRQLVKILDNCDEFKEDLLKIYNVNPDVLEVLRIGNAKSLITSINQLDSQCKKIDIVTKIKDVQLKKLLEAEKAVFEIFSITDNFILKKNRSDILEAETRYSAKTDILDYYDFSKFANYCRDNEFEDLIETINGYLKIKNSKNEEKQKLRLIYQNEDNKFYIRAMTSSQDYKNFGINFSVFVALMSLNKYVENTENEIYIDEYMMDDSTLYVSFSLNNKISINEKLSLSFNLILENDEIKRNAVSFNGIFKLKLKEKGKNSEIYLKPKGLKKENQDFPVDLLTYAHRGNVENVFEKIQDLPTLIEHFIKQISEDAIRISKIENPDDVRKFISHKIKYSKKVEFKSYKEPVLKKLQSITVDNIFRLFELLREVEDLFEHDDIVSINFWRTKLYEALVERK